MAFRKLKNLQEICIIIRRFDDPNKTNKINKIVPNFFKLQRLRKLRTELLRVENLKENEVLSMYTVFKKFYLLKSLAWTITESPTMSTEDYTSFVLLMKKLRKLESYKEYWTVNTGISTDVFNSSHDCPSLPKLPKLKNIEIMYSVAKEWSHKGGNEESHLEGFKDYFNSQPNLESYKCKVIKTSFPSQDILFLFSCFASLQYLRHLEFEFLKGSPLSIDYIEKFVERASTMQNLEKFDFYFRKHYNSAREISRLEKVFSQFKDVKYSLSPQSIYLYKNKTVIEP